MSKTKNYDGLEKRKYLRVKYLNVEKPKIKIGRHKFEVLDISQRGLRFTNNKEVILPEYVSGKLTLLHGESVTIEGSLLWEQDDDFGLYLKNLITSAIIQKEQAFIQKRL